jgi:hypothetical protein
VLEDAGVVRSARLDREQIREIEPGRVLAARPYLEQIAARWEQALGRIKAALERRDAGERPATPRPGLTGCPGCGTIDIRERDRSGRASERARAPLPRGAS